jgi:geranylgeranyl diphosphate synthase type II
MVAGQMADLALTGQAASAPQLRYMAQRKTGALFGAAVLSAAHLAAATQQEIEALRAYSDQLGLTFQIADDLLDALGEQDKLGKPLGSDAKNSKSTFLALLGQEEARRQATQAAQAARLALAPLGERAELLRQFPALMLSRDN